MDATKAISSFKSRFSMYANATLEAQQKGKNWDIYIKGSTSPIGYVTSDGIAHLY